MVHWPFSAPARNGCSTSARPARQNKGNKGKGAVPGARAIRVIVVGDSCAGKSSLIYSLMTEQFPAETRHPRSTPWSSFLRKSASPSPASALPSSPSALPAVLEEMGIPGKFNPDGMDVVLVDTPSDLISLITTDPNCKWADELHVADAIVLVYDATSEESFRRLTTHWLPKLTQASVTRAHRPIVLAGNQIDRRGTDSGNASLEQQILPVMAEFATVETCIECSARTLVNVAEVFYFAVKSVLHPSYPLYGDDNKLTPTCMKALQRIFRHIDSDGNGCLDDRELAAFQRTTFGTALTAAEIKGIKESLVATGCPDGVDPILGITEEGFMHLNKLFIQRGRLETTWTILRRFGYDTPDLVSEEGNDDERGDAGEGSLVLNANLPDWIDVALPDLATTALEVDGEGWRLLRDLFNRFSHGTSHVIL